MANWDSRTRKAKLSKINVIYICVVILLFPGVLNNLRYEVESRLGINDVSLYPREIGIQDSSNKGSNDYVTYNLDYDLEFNWEDGQYLRISKDDFSDELDFVVMGTITNSKEPLVVIQNNKVIYKDNVNNRINRKFWERSYLEHNFFVELEPLKEREMNKIEFILEDKSAEYLIYFE